MLREVHIKNYKSIASAVVQLGKFTVLVGPNGAGKSNVLDSLRFVSDALDSTLSVAIQSRGGISAVRRRSRGHPTHFGMRIILDFDAGSSADYSFEIGSRPNASFEVVRERLRYYQTLKPTIEFNIERGELLRAPEGVAFQPERDRLALGLLSGVSGLRRIYDALVNMRFYSPEPQAIRAVQTPDPGLVLEPSGMNSAAVLREIRAQRPDDYQTLCELLSKVVPGTFRVEYKSLGAHETLQFKQDIGDSAPWTFESTGISDGTLRVLGILLAVYQVEPPSLIAIEEPESTIHPAALDVLVGILKESADDLQVVITTHSPQLLDDGEITNDQLLAVESRRGKTRVGPVDRPIREAMLKNLFTGGELLQAGELLPDAQEAEDLEAQQSLFGAPRSSR